jgi:hypothetical protein
MLIDDLKAIKMTKLFYLLFFVTYSHLCLGQISKNDSIFIIPGGSTSFKLKFLSENSEAAKIIAKQDIENDSIFILLSSGISPVVYTTDSIFEVKYKVHFNDYGCSGASKGNMKNYNYVVFDFLETKYGKVWRKEIRKDAIGFKEWKRNN